jgi:hypothetical protein
VEARDYGAGAGGAAGQAANSQEAVQAHSEPSNLGQNICVQSKTVQKSNNYAQALQYLVVPMDFVPNQGDGYSDGFCRSYKQQ